MTVGRLVGLVIAVLMVVAGALWTAQGFGWVGRSDASGQAVLAIVGPLVAGLGIALGVVVVQRIREPPRSDGLRDRYGR